MLLQLQPLWQCHNRSIIRSVSLYFYFLPFFDVVSHSRMSSHYIRFFEEKNINKNRIQNDDFRLSLRRSPPPHFIPLHSPLLSLRASSPIGFISDALRSSEYNIKRNNHYAAAVIHFTWYRFHFLFKIKYVSNELLLLPFFFSILHVVVALLTMKINVRTLLCRANQRCTKLYLLFEYTITQILNEIEIGIEIESRYHKRKVRCLFYDPCTCWSSINAVAFAAQTLPLASWGGVFTV